MRLQLNVRKLQSDSKCVSPLAKHLLGLSNSVQVVADAYYVLYDAERRKEYDAIYGSRADRTEDADASSNFFTNFANMFTGKGAGAEPAPGPERPDAEGVFANVFEEVCPCLVQHTMQISDC